MANELTDQEIEKLRYLMDHFSFSEKKEDSDGSADGGNVSLEPGNRGDDDAVDGRIIMHNPGGVTRPFVTVQDGDKQLDIYLGSDSPAVALKAAVGSIFIEYGMGRGERPIKIHRRSQDGWVWSKWS